MEKSLKQATKPVAFKCKFCVISTDPVAVKDLLQLIEDHPKLELSAFEKDVVPIKTFAEIGKF